MCGIKKKTKATLFLFRCWMCQVREEAPCKKARSHSHICEGKSLGAIVLSLPCSVLVAQEAYRRNVVETMIRLIEFTSVFSF